MGRYVIADIEATGLGPDRQMIEIALITVNDGKVIDVYETLLNPLVPLPKHIYDLTLIHPRELEKAPKFYEVAEAIADRLKGASFVSHNVAFDWPMLQAAFDLLGKPIQSKILCTLKLSQELIPGLKGYSLEEMCRFFNIKTAEKHRALPDARAALDLFRELMELRTEARPDRPLMFLPQHETFLKKIPHQAGVITFKDGDKKILRLEASADIHETFSKLLNVRQENRDLLTTCETVEWEVTGSPLVAAFKRAKFDRPRWRWMITVVEDAHGQMNFHKEPFKPNGLGRWFFEGHADCQKKMHKLRDEFPQQVFAWREGGPTKGEIVEHNQIVERLLRETKFPSDNMLLWGPGREAGEWAYVLVRQGELLGWGFDLRPPEEVLLRPESILKIRFGKIPTEKVLAIRYLREHRENRFKKDQWRALKEKEC